MVAVHIFQPVKTAMQSGKAKSQRWILAFERENKRYIEPVMKWVASKTTQQQVQLFFSSREEAEAFAKANGWDYHVDVPQKRKFRPKSYADNFQKP